MERLQPSNTWGGGARRTRTFAARDASTAYRYWEHLTLSQDLDLATLQSQANGKIGSRLIPAREIPVPAELGIGDAALAAAAYSPAWNMVPFNRADWHEAQRGFSDRLAPVLAKVRENLGVSLTPTSVGGVPAYILAPEDIPATRQDRLVLFLHGGGYVLGQGEAGTAEAALMAAFGGYKVLCLDYRLAPDAPYPAALDDAIAAWRALIETMRPDHLAVAGLSAGAGLAMALMLRLKAEDLPLPAALSLGSPLSDLTPTGDSYKTNEWLDNVLVSYDGYLSRAIAAYANGTDLREPGVSPIYGDLSDFPPTTLATGTRDLFMSNTVRAHRKLRDAGVTAELHVYEGMSHAQFALSPDAEVTRTAYGEIAHFFDRQFSVRSE